MKFYSIFLLVGFLSLSHLVQAQSYGNAREATIQLTFIPPLGTNGTQAGQTINKISLNVLGGYALGLKGAEFGAIVNVNKEFVEGFQFAGITNYTHGTVNGFQFAGINNFNLGEAQAFQFAGIVNTSMSATRGVQGAGIVNFAWGQSSLIQAAGIVNVGENIFGAQLSGIGNTTWGDMKGAQISGIGNLARHVKGAQLSGIGNVSKSIKGAQVAGIFNATERLEGVQVGLINVVDTLESGVPIGFISIVRNGFHQFEIGFSEGMNTYASFKLGISQFYNIFSIGIQYFSDHFRWGPGYGIGSILRDDEQLKISLEAMSYHIVEGTTWPSGYNGLQQLKLGFSTALNEQVEFFGGPSLNLMVSEWREPNGKLGSDFPPYHIVEHTGQSTNLKFWIGFAAGLRIH